MEVPVSEAGFEQDRSDLKADQKKFKNLPITYPGLTDCVKDYLSKFFDRSLLDAIRWDHGIPWYVPMDAAAFTLDDMIYFAAGEYTPLDGISNREMELIGHEVAHSRQYRENGSLRMKGKYLFESAKGALIGGVVGGGAFAWSMSYYGNKYEHEAAAIEKKIKKNLRKEATLVSRRLLP
jgi:hypothetical protein